MPYRTLFFFLVATSCFAADIHFLILPETVIGPVSPYVYGLNAQDPTDTGATVRRLGGNRMTGYNWVNNASNAGNDYKHISDDWLCNGLFHYTNCNEPAGLITSFVAENQKAGMESLVTVPMAGFVAADEKGEVTEAETAPSDRWKPILFRKRTKYTLTPNIDAKVIYEDEFVNYLVNKLHSADQGGVKFYSLDNEPDLWAETHPRIHPKKTTYWELANKSQNLAYNILKVDPTAMIFGPASYGWSGFLTLQDAPDSADTNQSLGTFLDFYLDQMRYIEKRNGVRELHVLDLHWYPEAQGGGKRITGNDIDPASVDARLQAPRSLWDPGYMEKSWITESWKKPIMLIPWVKEKIDKHYPGTRLAFTEYDYGAGDHISGGLAQADVLGIFGKYGVFMSNYFGDLKPYNKAAFQLYRNYDAQHDQVGDTSVSAASDDLTQTSVYAFTNSKKPGELWLVVINKNQKETLSGKFKISGQTVYKNYQSYGFDATSPAIKPLKKGGLGGNQFDYSLPPLTATLIVLTEK